MYIKTATTTQFVYFVHAFHNVSLFKQYHLFVFQFSRETKPHYSKFNTMIEPVCINTRSKCVYVHANSSSSSYSGCCLFSMCLSFLLSRIKQLNQKGFFDFYCKFICELGTGIFSSAKRKRDRSAVWELKGAKNSVAYSRILSGFMMRTDWTKSETRALMSGWW